ncbi:MAG TPA: hypothetical protein ENN56_02135 [Firmicutes bacterium]|nr:hypothetical protein [Bacillota bacterium]
MNRITPNLRTVVALIVALAASFVLTGCSADPDDQGLTEINFLLDWKPQMEQAGFVVALEKGYYREAGLKVNFLEGQGATTTAALVGTGQYPLGIASGGATIIARARGAKPVSVALINQRSPTVIFALASSGIRTPSDLVGRSIALTKSGVKYDEYRALMAKLGIDRSSINEVDVRKAVVPSLMSGSVDAALGYTEDQPVLVELQGHEVIRIPIHRYGVNILSTNIIAHEDFISAQPDIVRRFVKASLKGWKRAIEYPDEAVMIYAARYPESNEDFVRENFRQFRPILFSSATDTLGLGAQTLEGFRETERTLRELGIIDQHVNPEHAFTNDFLPRIFVDNPEVEDLDVTRR